MERTYIENGRRSTSKESTRRNPYGKEKPRSTVEKMERRTGLNKPPAYMKRRRRRRRRRRRIDSPKDRPHSALYKIAVGATGFLLDS